MNRKFLTGMLAAAMMAGLSGCANTTDADNQKADQEKTEESQTADSAKETKTESEKKPVAISDDVMTFTLDQDSTMPGYVEKVFQISNPNEDYLISNISIRYQARNPEGKVVDSGWLVVPEALAPKQEWLAEIKASQISGWSSDDPKSEYYESLTYTFHVDTDKLEYIPKEEAGDYAFEVSNVDLKRTNTDYGSYTEGSLDVTNKTKYNGLEGLLDIVFYKDGKPIYVETEYTPWLNAGDTALVDIGRLVGPGSYDEVKVFAAPQNSPFDTDSSK